MKLDSLTPEVVEDELGPALPDRVDPAGHPHLLVRDSLPVREGIIVGKEGSEGGGDMELVRIRVTSLRFQLLYCSGSDLEVLIWADILLVHLQWS